MGLTSRSLTLPKGITGITEELFLSTQALLIARHAVYTSLGSHFTDKNLKFRDNI